MSSIKVAVRCRPLFDGERAASGLDVQNRRILLDSKTYDPDYTFPPSSNQDDIFQICKPVLDVVKEGGLNGTIMVYGQTGTGKTYTMLGNDGQDNGLVHKVIQSMLEHVQAKSSEGAECALTLSMVEIYNERLTDMLSVNGSEEVTLINGFPRFTNKVTLCRIEDANKAVNQGLSWRHTAATAMNEHSSRSHVVFIVDYEEVNAYTNETDVSHLFLVDLAGSESLKKSQAVGTVAGEAGKINKSLLALKSVFLALSNTNEASRPSHVPYRDSRLTELLQDSIGGTARTLMIACISAVGRDIEETKSTLTYAVKARSIRNATNSEREKLLIRLRSLEVENQRLRNRLEDRVTERGSYTIGKEEHQRYQQLEEDVEQLRQAVSELVKDNQAIRAREHIAESRRKALEIVIEEKDAEVERYRLVYQEALKKFELQARSLQRAVQLTVGEAKETAERLSQAQYSQLEEWRKAVEEAADQTLKPLTSSSSLAGCGETPLRTKGGSDDDEDGGNAPKSSPTPSRVCKGGFLLSSSSRRSSLTPPRALGSGHRFGSECASSFRARLDQKDEEADTAHSERLPQSPLETTCGALHESDEACHRILRRIHTAFQQVIHTMLREKESFQQRLHQIQSKRREKVTSAVEQLQQTVRQSVQQILKEEERARQEEEQAVKNWDSSCRSAAESVGKGGAQARVPEAEFMSLRHVSRNLCRQLSHSAARCFPAGPEPPTSLVSALQHIALAHQNQLGKSVVDQLEPLSSSPACGAAHDTPRASDSSVTSASPAKQGGGADGAAPPSLPPSARTSTVAALKTIPRRGEETADIASKGGRQPVVCSSARSSVRSTGAPPRRVGEKGGVWASALAVGAVNTAHAALAGAKRMRSASEGTECEDAARQRRSSAKRPTLSRRVHEGVSEERGGGRRRHSPPPKH